VILNIPLSPLYPPDRLTWKGTKDGVFSVCSAYHLGVELQANSRGQSSHTSPSNEIWKFLWSHHVSNPVKAFLWRACNNLLPTKMNLFQKWVVEEALCPICGREEEDTTHVVWNCLGARDVWGGDASCNDPFSFLLLLFFFFNFLYTKHFININLLKYKWIFIVARRYVAKPTYGTYPIICTW